MYDVVVRRVRVAGAHPGHVRDPQNETENAHSQGHQLLLPQEGQDFGPKLVFNEGDGNFHIAKLGNQREKMFIFSFIVAAVMNSNYQQLILTCFLPLKLAEKSWSRYFQWSSDLFWLIFAHGNVATKM